ncbi:hypothetical protein GGR88_001559 [Sphingomonas jejuensis]|uniref:AsmA domain-containing protein n=1 Tax=Sphingomonas jejuensis TaxID=904715 RepID=A0ABX0XN12_9SPHN|nr:AsmA family protein [Sphingomonas jejuensis]NJC34085.1 hypothetical protein [Sphingomonas jejuensis]
MLRTGWGRVAVISGGVLLVLILLLAAFPFGLFRSQIERSLSDEIGRPVTIGAMERVDLISFSPRIRFADVRVPQPAWAEARAGGDLARVEEAEVQIRAIPLLVGDVRVAAVELTGGRFNLYRAADGRENWTGQGGNNESDGGGPALETLRVEDAVLSYRDDKQRRSLSGQLIVDARGLALAGSGDVRGNPVTVMARGAPITAATAAAAWPFRVQIEGEAVGMTLAGRMDRPLDAGHLTARMTAHGRDLKLLDALIEAGLPGTQPVRLSADVRRTSPDWRIERLSGTIGRSDIAGQATVTKRDGRTRIEGALRSRRFDFDDLANDEGKRRALAEEARAGERIIPGTKIDLAKLDDLDGRVELTVDRLLWPGSTPFRTLAVVAEMDRSRLVLAPVRLGLTRGVLEGRMSVDQRTGRPVLSLALGLRGARLLDFFPATQIDGSLRGRFVLTGPGSTIRQAIGRSTGTIALMAEDGVIPARTASLLGQDVGRGLTTDADAQARLRCMVARLSVQRGTARPDPVVIDTSRAVTRANGTINLANERLSLSLSGAPKQRSLLRLSGDVRVGGTISQPDIQVPPEARSVGGVLKMLGDAIAGRQEPRAGDSDCAALIRRALR